MNHKTYVNAMGKILNIFPGVYFLLLILFPPLILGIALDSPIILSIALIVHIVFIFKMPFYLGLWRILTYGFRLLYTILLHRFLFHLSRLVGFNTSYADISDAHSVADFYKDKKRSIRRRMTKTIPEKIAKNEVEVNYISSNWINIENLKVQYIHSRKYYSKIFPIYRIVLGLFTLVGGVTEYRVKGKLVGQSISFLRGDSFTVLQYGCAEEVSRIGLWFYNIFENIRQAISMKAQFINGTIEVHKPEAKLNAGFMSTNVEELVFRLYGGSFTNFPKRFHNQRKISPKKNIR